ncbi:MAG: NAD(+)/NADH kinase [Fervidicoccaceae archaeon]
MGEKRELPDGPVGLIINPVAGTDLRRLTSTAAFMDNNMKVRLARSVIGGMAGLGIREFAIMPDYLGVFKVLIESLSLEGLELHVLDMEAEGGPDDTRNAVKQLIELNSPLIVSLGGDGTVRVIAEHSGETPILPISTGTNNTIPYFTEGTVAGLAAGYYLRGLIDPEISLMRAKKLVIEIDGRSEGIGLVEVSMTDYPFRGAAMIDVSRVIDSVISIADPTGIGVSSVGGMLRIVKASSRYALRVLFGKGKKVRAAVYPGVVKDIDIKSFELLPVGSRVELAKGQYVEADGERLFHVSEENKVTVFVSDEGPYILDIPSIMSAVSARGLAISS